jgi:hypothetical protein
MRRSCHDFIVRGYETKRLKPFRYLDLLDDRLLVDEVLGRVSAVRADPRRQPLACEQLVHWPASSSSMGIPANLATRNASAGVTARLPVATFWIESHS